MGLLLCLETATRICSVALYSGHHLLAFRESDVPNIHSAKLTVFIDEVLRESGVLYHDLEAVAVSMGPGSYTGLRIGVAAAKGLCYALGKPLIAVPTLQAMASGMSGSEAIRSIVSGRTSFLCCPMIDARRMEVYCGIYDQDNREVREVRAEIVDGKSFGEFLQKEVILFAGDGSGKCREVLGSHPNAFFDDSFTASALYMQPIAKQRIDAGQTENVAYFEPFYLKEFVAGKPYVKGLRPTQD